MHTKHPENLQRIRLLRALKLKNTRKEAGITQIELAVFSGLHCATIRRLESGEISCNQDSELIYLDAIEKIISQKSLSLVMEIQ